MRQQCSNTPVFEYHFLLSQKCSWRLEHCCTCWCVGALLCMVCRSIVVHVGVLKHCCTYIIFAAKIYSQRNWRQNIFTANTHGKLLEKQLGGRNTGRPHEAIHMKFHLPINQPIPENRTYTSKWEQTPRQWRQHSLGECSQALKYHVGTIA